MMLNNNKGGTILYYLNWVMFNMGFHSEHRLTMIKR